MKKNVDLSGLKAVLEGRAAPREAAGILRRLPDGLIIEYVGMAELPLIVYLLSLKYRGRYRLINLGGDCMIRFGRTNVANMSYLAAFIHFIRVEGDVLRVEGNVSLPAAFGDRCRFYAVVNGEKRACTFSEAGMDRELAGAVYEKRTAFLLEQHLEEGQAVEIAFGISTDGIESVCGKINAMRFSPVADCLEGQYAVRGGRLLRIMGNKLLCMPMKEGEAQVCEQAFLARVREAVQISELSQTGGLEQMGKPSQAGATEWIREPLQAGKPSQAGAAERIREPLQAGETSQAGATERIREPEQAGESAQSREPMQTQEAPQAGEVTSINSLPHRDSLPPQAAERICRIREAYFHRKARKKKQIWLFFDRIDKADDNGEAMFSYVCSLGRDDIDACFVTGKDIPDFHRLQAVGNVVEALSFEHCVLLLLADYILTSQLNGYVENPFGEYEEYFRDLYHQPKVIFLQHGITKDNQTWWLNRYYQNLHAVIASAQAEKDAFLRDGYFYGEAQIWLTGMPRYDTLSSEERNYILFMPTWREHLMEQRLDGRTHTYRWHLKENFRASAYYRYYHTILNDRELAQCCEETGYRLVLMPHPIMQPYIEEFGAGDWVMKFPYHARWRELFAWSSLMVTDYSSVAFDFAYLKKPILYYQFDRESFFASHTYTEGYFEYETMGFGETARGERELAGLLMRYLREGCRMQDFYRERVDRFFAFHDRGCCERIFRKIMAEGAGE